MTNSAEDVQAYARLKVALTAALDRRIGDTVGFIDERVILRELLTRGRDDVARQDGLGVSGLLRSVGRPVRLRVVIEGRLVAWADGRWGDGYRQWTTHVLYRSWHHRVPRAGVTARAEVTGIQAADPAESVGLIYAPTEREEE